MWKKWWLLFTVIWVVVAGLQAVLILTVSEGEEEKALRPILVGIGVPALLYLVGMLWTHLISPARRPPEK